MSIVPTTRTFVISLQGAVKRRAHFTEDAKTNIEWRFFDASTKLGAGLDYDERRALIRGGRMLTRAELGCYSSHHLLWRQLLSDESVDRYLIFEDDILVDWRFIEQFVALSEHEMGASFLRLFFTKTVPTRKIVSPFLDFYQIVELLEFGYGAAAYMIDKVAAARMVETLREVIEPVDLAMESAWRHGVRNLSVFPFPIIHKMGESQIGNERRESASKPLWMKIVRGGLRVRNNLRKRVWHHRLARR